MKQQDLIVKNPQATLPSHKVRVTDKKETKVSRRGIERVMSVRVKGWKIQQETIKY